VVKFAPSDSALAERLTSAASQMKLFDDDATDSPTAPLPEHSRRRRASILWAILVARIYEVWPLVCLRCSSAMKLIAFIIEPFTIQKILNHIGLPTEPPRLTPARDPHRVEMTFAADVLPDELAQERHHQHYDPHDALAVIPCATHRSAFRFVMAVPKDTLRSTSVPNTRLVTSFAAG
jgi:hypothetical protein